MQRETRWVAWWLASAGWWCGCARDEVRPGFYGDPGHVERGVKAAASAASATSAARAAEQAGHAAPSAQAGSGGSIVAEMELADSQTEADSSGDPASTRDPGSDACDLSGRWLLTLHYVTDALGQQQTVHSFVYYEIERSADGFAIAKALACGEEGVAEGLFAISADFKRSWPSTTERIRETGRELGSKPTSGGCEVHFAKWYTVRGASYPYYTDPGVPLPSIDQPAKDGMPGWEDWDEDGNPGITSMVSGTVTGKIFLAPRWWTQLSGVVPDTRSRMKLALEWNQETNLLGYDGSPLLTTEAVRAADPSLAFGELARLADDQATGDDLAICRAAVELAPTLTPNGCAI